MDGMLSAGKNLSDREQERLKTIRALYEQQKFMYDNKVHSVPDRIVSLSQPYVRPIVQIGAGIFRKKHGTGYRPPVLRLNAKPLRPYGFSGAPCGLACSTGRTGTFAFGSAAGCAEFEPGLPSGTG